ncbi:MAG: hypothetical protein H0S79_14575 [Anaerolineaceae bacterium]|nr:hypothetical protein [Anaerolineaceae bacterium]
MKKSTKVFRTTLRVLSIVALILYILFLFGERVPLGLRATFAENSVYLLFLIFVLGFVVIWKNELIAGIVLIVWYGIQWCLVLWVWPDGGMTVILGFPIAILGVIALIYGLRNRRPSNSSE